MKGWIEVGWMKIKEVLIIVFTCKKKPDKNGFISFKLLEKCIFAYFTSGMHKKSNDIKFPREVWFSNDLRRLQLGNITQINRNHGYFQFAVKLFTAMTKEILRKIGKNALYRIATNQQQSFWTKIQLKAIN